MKKTSALLLLGLSACAALPVHAADVSAPAAVTTAAPPKAEFLWSPGGYTTDFGVAFPLSDKPIPLIKSDQDATIYDALLTDWLVPHYMQLGAQVYPVPVLATWLKSHSPTTYKKGDLGNTGVNLVESSSTHYQDPWSVSAFLGNIADLQAPGQDHPSGNGYTGWLISAGAQRIKDNALVQDKWYDVEWQVRGGLASDQEQLGWNFRIGTRLNANPYVEDATYIGIARDDLDLRAPFLGWLNNSHIDIQIEVANHGGRMLREHFIIGKKYPMTGYAITFDTGFVWDSFSEYSGPLRDNPKSDYTLVFEPGIEF